jgi:hypothetical protein
MTEWKFQDPPNVAVITTTKVLNGEDWVAFVSHDGEDGGWQFHNNEPGPLHESDAKVVSLQNMVRLDPSIVELADLPLGWHAQRDSRNSPWKRVKG